MSACSCRCHVHSGSFTSCDIGSEQPGGLLSCTPCNGGRTSDERVCPGRHGVRHPAPALRNDEYLCRGCVRDAERALGDLPALTRELEITVSRQTAGFK